VTPALLLALLATIVVAEWLLDAVAQTLQLRHQPPEPPRELADAVDGPTYARSLAYVRARTRARLWHGAATAVVWLVLLGTGALAAGYAAVEAWTGGGMAAPLLFLAAVGLGFDLVALPFDLQRTFGIEARFGFNTTTVGTFVRDRITGYALAALLGGALAAALLASIDAWGPSFWLPYAVVAAAVVAALGAFQTSVLLPLFNRLTPLPAGDLRRAIAAYVERAGFRLDDTYVMDGSKRSTKANAFFSGLGPQKKVVLFDTLLVRHPNDEVVAVVAHEVGHARLRHLPWLLLASVASLTFTLFLLSRVVESEWPSLALGAERRVVALNLVAFALAFGPVSTVVGVAANALSRAFEYQADAFAARSFRHDATAAALRRLAADSLSLPTAHPLYAWLYLTHPAPVDRLRALAVDATADPPARVGAAPSVASDSESSPS
jgi:STE24 endopeptidase